MFYLLFKRRLLIGFNGDDTVYLPSPKENIFGSTAVFSATCVFTPGVKLCVWWWSQSVFYIDSPVSTPMWCFASSQTAWLSLLLILSARLEALPDGAAAICLDDASWLSAYVLEWERLSANVFVCKCLFTTFDKSQCLKYTGWVGPLVNTHTP